MRKRLFYIAFIVLLLAATIGVTARSDETPIDVKLQELALHIHEEAWPAADGTLTSLRNEWKRRRVWFMLNKNIERIYSSDRILAQLEAAVDSRDGATASGHLAELTQVWRELKN